MQHWHCSWDSHSRWPQWWWYTFGPYNWRIGQDPDPQARIRWWDLCLIRHLSGHTKVHVVLLECLEKSKDSWHSPKSQFMQGRTKIRGPTREECTTVQHVEKAHDNGKLHYLLQNRHLQWHQPQSLPDSILLSIPIILTFKDVLTRNHILLKTTYSRNRFFCLTFKYASLWQLLGNTSNPINFSSLLTIPTAIYWNCARHGQSKALMVALQITDDANITDHITKEIVETTLLYLAMLISMVTVTLLFWLYCTCTQARVPSAMRCVQIWRGHLMRYWNLLSLVNFATSK